MSEAEAVDINVHKKNKERKETEKEVIARIKADGHRDPRLSDSFRLSVPGTRRDILDFIKIKQGDVSLKMEQPRVKEIKEGRPAELAEDFRRRASQGEPPMLDPVLVESRRPDGTYIPQSGYNRIAAMGLYDKNAEIPAVVVTSPYLESDPDAKVPRDVRLRQNFLCNPPQESASYTIDDAAKFLATCLKENHTLETTPKEPGQAAKVLFPKGTGTTKYKSKSGEEIAMSKEVFEAFVREWLPGYLDFNKRLATLRTKVDMYAGVCTVMKASPSRMTTAFEKAGYKSPHGGDDRGWSYDPDKKTISVHYAEGQSHMDTLWGKLDRLDTDNQAFTTARKEAKYIVVGVSSLYSGKDRDRTPRSITGLDALKQRAVNQVKAQNRTLKKHHWPPFGCVVFPKHLDHDKDGGSYEILDSMPAE